MLAGVFSASLAEAPEVMVGAVALTDTVTELLGVVLVMMPSLTVQLMVRLPPCASFVNVFGMTIPKML